MFSFNFRYHQQNIKYHHYTEVNHILFSKDQSQTDNRPGTLNELSQSHNPKMKLFTTVAAALAASQT